MIDGTSKFLYESKLICGKPHPFGQIIFTSGTYFVSFATPCSGFKLPAANAALLAHGATASDAILDRIHRLSSVRRHYDESQGDLNEWLTMPLAKIIGVDPLRQER